MMRNIIMKKIRRKNGSIAIARKCFGYLPLKYLKLFKHFFFFMKILKGTTVFGPNNLNMFCCVSENIVRRD